MGCHLWQAQLALFLCIIHTIFASLSVMGALRFADVRYQTPQIARDDHAVSMSVSNMSFTLYFASPPLSGLRHYCFYHWTQVKAVAYGYRIEVVWLKVDQHSYLAAAL